MHTSGPWVPRNADFVEEEIIANVDQDDYGDLICDKICVVDCGNPRWRENARLITAAPVLLDEARKQVAWLQHLRSEAVGSLRGSLIDGIDQSIKYLSAAIAKATGKP